MIYARFSSHRQREVSIEQQVEACQAFAASGGYSVIDIYADRAISGKTDRRPNFQRMMADAQAGKFSYVIAWKSSRMGRNMMEAMQNDSRLRGMGVKTLYAEEDFDDTAAGRFSLRTMMNVNQFYSENLAEDIMRGMEDNARRCKVNGLTGLGFKRGPDGCYALDPPNDAIVREAYERVNALEPIVDICQDFNARGLRTSSGSVWNKNSFRALLRAERNRGVYTWGGTRVEGGVPRIVSDELFYSVGRVLEMKNVHGRHRDAADYLLTGKLYCGHCGSFMVGICGTSKTGEKHHYYSCNKKRLEKVCQKKNVRRDWIEHKVVEAVKANVMQPGVIEWLLDGYEKWVDSCRRDSLLASYESELADVNRALKNLVSAIELGLFSAATKERLNELEAERQRLQSSIALEKAALVDVPREKVEFFIRSFMDGDVESKEFQARLIDHFVQAVYLYDDHLRIVCNYTGTKNSVDVSFAEVDGADDCSLSGFAQAPRWITRKKPIAYAVGFFSYIRLRRVILRKAQ